MLQTKRSRILGTSASTRVTAAAPIFEGKEVVMGLIRKLTYLGTCGVIDIRSDTQRIASYSKKLTREHEKADA